MGTLSVMIKIKNQKSRTPVGLITTSLRYLIPGGDVESDYIGRIVHVS